jgi:hypothetical protein
MATQNLTAGETRNNHAGAVKAFVVEQVIDFSQTLAASGDVIQAINVQPGWFVAAVLVETLKAEGAAATANVGDGALATGFMTAANLNLLGMTKSNLTLTEAAPNTVTGYTAGKLYTAADTIDLVVSAALDAAKVAVRALVFDLS